MAGPARKPRRPKPVNFGKRRALRLGADEEAAVAAMRAALAKNRGTDAEQVPFSEGLRLLLTENIKAAQVLAGQPGAWALSQSVDVPAELWDGLTDCHNRLSHSQGSLYTILRKLNFDETVTKDEVRVAFEAVQESKTAVARMEDRLVSFVTTASAAAAAEADTQAV